MNSRFHEASGYNAHRVNEAVPTYASTYSGPQLSASISPAFPSGSAPSVISPLPLATEYYQSAAGGAMLAPSGVPPICQWEQCGAHLEDTSPSGVKRHLRTHHGITRADCERGERGVCQWYIDGRPCSGPLDFSSFPKHVSTVHLKATARRCGDCGRRIGRADSLTRHQRDHCPVRRHEQWPGPWESPS